MMSQLFQWYGSDFVADGAAAPQAYACRFHDAKYSVPQGPSPMAPQTTKAVPAEIASEVSWQAVAGAAGDGPEVTLCEFLEQAGPAGIQIQYIPYDWDLNYVQSQAPLLSLPRPAVAGSLTGGSG